jgi:hypothetical protein
VIPEIISQGVRVAYLLEMVGQPKTVDFNFRTKPMRENARRADRPGDCLPGTERHPQADRLRRVRGLSTVKDG